MKTLSSPVSTEAAASQSAWCEVFDFYLKVAITTPWGTVSTLRLTTLPSGFTFFTPNIWPEPVGTRGASQAYQFWPLKRAISQGSTKYADPKMTIAASNVSADWAHMLSLVDWYDTPVMIRKVPFAVAGLTANDCAVVWSGFIDAARVDLQSIQFTCSCDLGSLGTVLPSENMHQACRFNWGDDYCTVLRYRTTNYKAGTCGSNGTATRLVSSDLSEDGATAGYVGQAVTVDASTDAVTLNSHGLNAGDRVKFGGTAVPGGLSGSAWYYVTTVTTNTFKVALTEFGAAIDITSNGTSVTIDSTAPYGTDLVDALSSGAITATHDCSAYTLGVGDIYADSSMWVSNHGFQSGDEVSFTGSPVPTPLSAGVWYYVLYVNQSRFWVSATRGGNPIIITNSGSSVAVTSRSFLGYRVRRQDTSGCRWRLPDSADWGTRTAGFWKFSDASWVGLANPVLPPNLTFDFGSAVRPKVWRIGSTPFATREALVRMVAIFSSTVSNFASYTHEGYFELPPTGGQFFDMLIPNASNARYWRICVRSKWAESFDANMLWKVSAYANARNFWASGRVTFAAATSTVALRGISREIRESWSGALSVSPLPVAPANGDTFTIERGCPRTWNGCCERRNWENFGGFLDLANQSMIR